MMAIRNNCLCMTRPSGEAFGLCLATDLHTDLVSRRQCSIGTHHNTISVPDSMSPTAISSPWAFMTRLALAILNPVPRDFAE